MSKSSKQFLSGVKVEVPEDRYKVDVELHDRFQVFSSELLKLALAGIAVFGLFLTLLGDASTDNEIKKALNSCSFKWLSIFSLVSFALSVGLALVHRFLASDGLYHHFRAIKSLILLEERPENPDFNFEEYEKSIRKNIKKDEEIRNRKFESSESALKASAALLAVGAVFLGAVFIRVVL